MSTESEFRKFASIPRLFRQCVVTEKIDGTNALVHVSEDGTVRAGSRSRWITPEDDNMGFAAWVRDHAEELRALDPGYHYGEWWGHKIQRGYGLNERRFSLFNTGRWHQHDKEPRPIIPGDPRQEIKFTTAAPTCCHVVPVLWTGDIFSGGRGPSEYHLLPVNLLIDLLKGGSVAAPGYDNPEGVVVYHETSGNLYKWTLGGDGHKGKRR